MFSTPQGSHSLRPRWISFLSRRENAALLENSLSRLEIFRKTHSASYCGLAGDVFERLRMDLANLVLWHLVVLTH